MNRVLLLICTSTKLLILNYSLLLKQKSSATIHIPKKANNNRQTRTYSTDKENEVGQPGDGEENCDDHQHLYNPLPVVRHE